MEIRWNWEKSDYLMHLFDQLLGQPFLDDFSRYCRENRVQEGFLLTIRWRNIQVKAFLFDGPTLLIDKIRRISSVTPELSCRWGES